ncbi:hypothetical protein Dsin_014284 [Dipteronia sinensis]|uniref:DUF4220 domain-containing protein n=1 Tax=Dipteronia sinensis TaxID=43782 RepID=A0AAE0E9W6_9ROSI|nr:hypothetical protein Dsin_014284 [Dipteronia sinensis]
MEIFPEKLKKIWNVWEIRGLVLSSLSLQVILILFGSRRKTNRAILIRVLVWCAYMSADWVATVCLSALATKDADPEDNSSRSTNSLQAFWAPFLLLHLGGPDTITACSLEDNELWLRHFLRFLVQVGVAIYVYLRTWNNSILLTYLAIPVFIVGIIKYAERTWVLRSSSNERLKHSLLTDPDPGPDVAVILEQNVQHRLKKDTKLAMVVPDEDIKSEKDYLVQGNFLFKRFLYLYTGLILGFYERNDSYSIIHNKSPEDAFKIVAVELGFMYDKLYTKASLVYSCLGLFIRCISLCLLSFTLYAFAAIIDKHPYQKIDIMITYSVLVGAIVLEVYAFILLIFSDWTKAGHNPLRSATCKSCPPHSLLNSRKRWSAVMGQHDLLSVCLKNGAKCIRVHKFFGIHEKLEKFNYKTSAEIQRMLKEKCDKIKDDIYFASSCKELLAQRGDYVLEKWKLLDEFSWCTVDVEFDHSLLLWHIATSICYYNDSIKGTTKNANSRYEISKCLSDYMLYVLVIRQTMLPKGIGEIRYRDTCAEARRFFKQKELSSDNAIKGACRKLLEVDVSSLQLLEDIKGDRSQSVLFSGCILAKKLENLEMEMEFEIGYEKK